MELLIGLALVILFLATLDYSAIRWGVNTRTGGSDWNPRPDEVYTERFGELTIER